MPIPGPASSQQTAQDPLRINVGPSLNHPAARLAQQETSTGPKTSTGIPSDFAKYGGKYNQGYSNQDRKPSLPVGFLGHSQENVKLIVAGQIVTRAR